MGLTMGCFYLITIMGHLRDLIILIDRSVRYPIPSRVP